ncbi:MAG: chemoreceptor glutamine deamidase CheD [Planctomycetes bacterium]|nr:chemoreceptor glutamine deamidase CheD [Planctomycetota bacterium]
MTTETGMKACFPGFESIHRFEERRSGETVAEIRPGEFYVTSNPERVVTILGSCIAACVRDRRTLVGGMNHFLLPADELQRSKDRLLGTRYGNFAMEALINEVLKHGGARNRLEIKLFGGARMIAGLSDVGQQNIDFVRTYLRAEQFSADVEDVGGTQARLVHFWPRTGRVRVKKIQSSEQLAAAEADYRRDLAKRDSGGSIELF